MAATVGRHRGGLRSGSLPHSDQPEHVGGDVGFLQSQCTRCTYYQHIFVRVGREFFTALMWMASCEERFAVRPFVAFNGWTAALIFGPAVLIALRRS